jgi:DNA-binding GntR family transcriptional regulator
VPLEVELDRSSPVPLYYQLAQAIEAAIRDGDLVPGDRFENELDLAKRLTLSRPTTRRAIQEIVDKGLLVRKRGVGTQVVQNPVHRRVELTSLFDDLARAGQEPTTELLDYQVGQAND